MNLPNKITLTRIAMIPVIIFLFLFDFKYHLMYAAIAFAVASCTDFIDGHIARSRNLVTNLGKFLDPIADKVLVVVGLFLICEAQIIPIGWGSIACILIMARELIIGALRQIAAANNVVLAADWWGKIKTVVTDIALPFLMIAPLTYVNGNDGVHYYIGIVLFAIATVLTVVSGINYLVKNKQVFIDQKE